MYEPRGEEVEKTVDKLVRNIPSRNAIIYKTKHKLNKTKKLRDKIRRIQK